MKYQRSINLGLQKYWNMKIRVFGQRREVYRHILRLTEFQVVDIVLSFVGTPVHQIPTEQLKLKYLFYFYLIKTYYQTFIFLLPNRT